MPTDNPLEPRSTCASRHARAVAGVAVVSLVTACATNGPLGLGGLEAARRARPDLFTRDCFERLGDRYVVCGSAERMLPEETDAELRDEARMDAQARLGASLQASELEVSGFTAAHEWRMCGGRVLALNFTVPVSSVAVVAPAPAGTSTPQRRRNPCSDD